MDTISWLHLTDWHVGQEGMFSRWPNTRAEFRRDLSSLISKTGNIDIIFLSGDLVQSGTQEEYSDFQARISEMIEMLASLGSTPSIVPVPGNHDLLRPTAIEPVPLALNAWNTDPAIEAAFWTRNSSFQAAVISWFENYVNWTNLSDVPFLKPVSTGLLPGDALYTFKKGALSVGILGLNSTFLQYCSGDLKGKLAISPNQIPLLPSGDYVDFLEQHEIRVLMTHHPKEWLSPNAIGRFESDIWPAGRFDVHYCGHEHEAKPTSTSNGGSVSRNVYQGTSFFGLEKIIESGEIVRRHGYLIGSWTKEGDFVHEKAWPRIAHKKHDGGFGLVADPSSYLDEDSCVTRSWPRKISSSTDCKSDDGLSVSVSTPEISLGNIGSRDNPIDSNRFPQIKQTAPPSHWQIRSEERLSLKTVVEHAGVAFVISDWGTGKDDFLTTCFFPISKHGDVKAYVLKCDSFKSVFEFEAGFKHQFGLSLNEFLNISFDSTMPILILDGIQPALTQGDSRHEFERFVMLIRDFSPKLRLVVVGRVPFDNGISTIHLRGLDLLETRSYIEAHQLSQPGLLTPDSIERLHFTSGGLPIQLDRLLERLQVASLDAVLDEEAENTVSTSAEDPSLAQCIRSLETGNSTGDISRTGALLKALCVLPFGETIEGIKRFLPNQPFYPTHAQNLLNLALVEAIPVEMPLIFGPVWFS